MTQYVIVYVIGALLLVWLIWRVVRIFTGKTPANPCANCPKDCRFREQ